MSRHRRPRPAGHVEIVCSGRGFHPRTLLWPLQLRRAGDELRLWWKTDGDGTSPVTPFVREDDRKTFVFSCTAKLEPTGKPCGRNPKIGEERLIRIALAALAANQAAGSATPIAEIDISRIERL